ncbi:MAG: hypothetical protein ACREU5_01520 [Burkholderiales bacterium]
MSGGFLLGLILASMLWLFFGFGAVVNFHVWRAWRKAKVGERVPSGIPFLPGLFGAIAMLLTLPAAARWLGWQPGGWGVALLVLPLVLDVYCLGWILLLPIGRRAPKNE